MEKNYNNYTYYKGEETCPFPPFSGKAVWWKIESYAAKAKDDKLAGRLSDTMLEYLRERVWQNDSGSTTTWEVGIKRSSELYKKGLWSAKYINEIDAGLPDD